MSFEDNIAPTKAEVKTDYVKDGDVIRLATANSSYEFSVCDCGARRGLLTGGALGEGPFNAFANSLLEEGYGARFLVALSGSTCRLVTSDIVNLVCIRDGQVAARKTIKFPTLDSGVKNYAS